MGRRAGAVLALAAISVGLGAGSSRANSDFEVRMVKDIRPGDEGVVPGASDPTRLIAHDGRVFFTASDGVFGVEPWKSDGTPAGTRMVRDVVSGSRGSIAGGPLVSAGELVYFVITCSTTAPDEYGPPCGTDNGYRHRQLWMTNGSAQATRLVPGASSGIPRFSPTSVGDRLLFRRALESGGTEIWITDGTAAGTTAIAGSQPPRNYSIEASGPRIEAARLRGFVMFSAYAPATGFELWRTDGTAATTGPVADIAPGPQSSAPYDLTRLGNRIYFLVGDGSADQPSQLWRTDGSTAGTELVEEFGTRVTAANMTLADDRLFFDVAPNRFSHTLWTSDGTPGGTTALRRVPGTPGLQDHHRFVPLGNRVFFIAYDSRHGYRLWSSNGTRRGTRSAGGTRPFGDVELGAGAEHVFFEGKTKRHRHEMYSVGVRGRFAKLVADIARGPQGQSGSNPSSYTAVGRRLFFTANDRRHGRELWVASP